MGGTLGSWQQSHAVMKPAGHFVTIAEGGHQALTFSRLMGRLASNVNRAFWGMCGYQKYSFLMSVAGTDTHQKVADMIEDGTLTPVLDSVFEFEQFQQAYAKS